MNWRRKTRNALSWSIGYTAETEWQLTSWTSFVRSGMLFLGLIQPTAPSGIQRKRNGRRRGGSTLRGKMKSTAMTFQEVEATVTRISLKLTLSCIMMLRIETLTRRKLTWALFSSPCRRRFMDEMLRLSPSLSSRRWPGRRHSKMKNKSQINWGTPSRGTTQLFPWNEIKSNSQLWKHKQEILH